MDLAEIKYDVAGIYDKILKGNMREIEKRRHKWPATQIQQIKGWVFKKLFAISQRLFFNGPNNVSVTMIQPEFLSASSNSAKIWDF